MDNLTEIWNTRGLRRNLPRHWVRFGEDIVISGERPEQFCVLSICRPDPDGRLFAMLDMGKEQMAEEIVRTGDLFLSIRDLRLFMAVRAVEPTRVLVEFGVPRGNRARIALCG